MWIKIKIHYNNEIVSPDILILPSLASSARRASRSESHPGASSQFAPLKGEIITIDGITIYIYWRETHDFWRDKECT
jgi:hypothetical protein